MSIPVDIDDLAATLDEFGPGYLLSVSAQATVKVVTVEPTMTERELMVSAPGRGTLANVAANETVTLVFPPTAERGFTLLIDGTAAAHGENVVVTPTGAVLHRPAAHSDGPPPPDGCGHDCRPVT